MEFVKREDNVNEDEERLSNILLFTEHFLHAEIAVRE